MSFHIVRNNIVKMSVDVIVNTANPQVCIGDGVDRCIYENAGSEQILKERRKIGPLRFGEVGITSAGKLNAKYIFHACGPMWCGGDFKEEEQLRTCFEQCLELAIEYQCTSIAFPLLSTGTYGYPRERVLQIAVNSFSKFLMNHDIEIYLVVFDTQSVKISGKLFSEIDHYIDQNYVEEQLESEYSSLPEGLQINRDEIEADIFQETAQYTICSSRDEAMSLKLDDFLQSAEDPFPEYLQQLINKKGFKNAEVYKRANMDKKYFSKLIRGKINPTKMRLLTLAIALQLNLDETRDLLLHAGYAINPANKTDLIFQYFIQNHQYDIFSIDIVLFDYGLPTIINDN